MRCRSNGVEEQKGKFRTGDKSFRRLRSNLLAQKKRDVVPPPSTPACASWRGKMNQGERDSDTLLLQWDSSSSFAGSVRAIPPLPPAFRSSQGPTLRVVERHSRQTHNPDLFGGLVRRDASGHSKRATNGIQVSLLLVITSSPAIHPINS